MVVSAASDGDVVSSASAVGFFGCCSISPTLKKCESGSDVDDSSYSYSSVTAFGPGFSREGTTIPTDFGLSVELVAVAVDSEVSAGVVASSGTPEVAPAAGSLDVPCGSSVVPKCCRDVLCIWYTG